MLQMARYAVIQKFSGIFTKKFRGNAHLIMLPPPGEFAIYNMLGTMENGREALLLVLKTSDTNEIDIVREISNTDNTKIVEELPCVAKEIAAGNYRIALKKKGKFIQDNMDVRYEPEYSSGDTRVYSVKGKFALAHDEAMTPTQLKMAAKSQIARLKSRLNVGKLNKMMDK